MVESDFNTIFGNAIKNKKWFNEKLKDPPSQVARMWGKNAFDGFAVGKGFNLYYECKLLKGIQSFNLKKIEDHQYANLIQIKNIGNIDNYCLVPIFIWLANKYNFIILVDISTIEFLKKLGKKSILQKEFEKIISLDRKIDIKNKTFDIDKSIIESVLITPEFFETKIL